MTAIERLRRVAGVKDKSPLSVAPLAPRVPRTQASFWQDQAVFVSGGYGAHQCRFLMTSREPFCNCEFLATSKNPDEIQYTRHLIRSRRPHNDAWNNHDFEAGATSARPSYGALFEAAPPALVARATPMTSMAASTRRCKGRTSDLAEDGANTAIQSLGIAGRRIMRGRRMRARLEAQPGILRCKTWRDRPN